MEERPISNTGAAVRPAALLPEVTAYAYDRRGRGDSGRAEPRYCVISS